MRNSGLETISDAAEPSIARRTPSQSPQADRENPGSTDASGSRSAPAAPPSRWRRPLLILGPVALIVGALGLYLATGRYVTEEDAYVQAVNVSISPQVAGQVVTIAAKSNIAVRKNDALFNLDPEPYRIALANAEAQFGDRVGGSRRVHRQFQADDVRVVAGDPAGDPGAASAPTPGNQAPALD